MKFNKHLKGNNTYQGLVYRRGHNTAPILPRVSTTNDGKKIFQSVKFTKTVYEPLNVILNDIFDWKSLDIDDKNMAYPVYE